jgi:hypothetical protein
MEGHNLRMLGNRLLWKTFGVKREKETGGLRKSHKEYFHDFQKCSNKMALFCIVFYSLQTALHVSGETFTHHQ